MNKVQFDSAEDLIDICWDNVFKSVFTQPIPESRGALSKLLSAIIGEELTVTNITANEPPIKSLRDRQIRFDINCVMNNGELCNVEMTLSPSVFELRRLEYYAGELHTSQDIRGTDKSWRDLKPSYQISFLMENVCFGDTVFIHSFEYYDPKNKVSLRGISHIITIELAKLDKIVEKSVVDMTSQERWSIFFRFLRDVTKRQIINEILAEEEGIAMAGAVLQTISRNQEERLRLITEHKNIMDWQSGMVEARREGIEEGIVKGRVEGIEEGIVKGRVDGITETRVENAKNLLSDGIEPERVAKYSGLSLDDVLKLQKDK
jgi:predicted transposase/invertase (TIGR01784 family)